MTPENNEPVSEQANGHPCHRIEKMAALSDGSTAKLTEWRADDLNRFPVRVRAESEGRRITVDFSDIRLDIPRLELFVPPGGFTQYASAAALINELMIRESVAEERPVRRIPPRRASQPTGINNLVWAACDDWKPNPYIPDF